MCEFRIQDGQHSPWRGLPQMAPWHHVGATMEITLDKNGSLYDPAGTESWNMQIRYETMKLTMHPTNNAGTFTRVPGGCLRWPPTPPGPRWPPALNLELERERTKEEKREKFYIYLDVTHTHTHARTILPTTKRSEALRLGLNFLRV